MQSNEVLEKLPKHLLSLIIDQPYNDYTPQDQAIWRYVMRSNVDYFPTVAHHSYLSGLKKTGITIEQIPQMYGMNRILKEIGWAAVAVDGFIPPAAFMEFQAYNVLVIAADIRPIDQIEYTPAPDIIHEAAGHAPIIADQEYSEYLRMIGFLGSKALPSKRDYELYNAVRHLSILKADPYTTAEAIAVAQAELDHISSTMGHTSELAQIRNLHWWSVEYGLIGDLKNPQIYGAGLLSSIAESHSCLKEQVAKYEFSINAKDFSFDVTRPQPQLFVTPNFEGLNNVLDQFASTMAVTVGGRTGIERALLADAVTTSVLNSGLQISGKLSRAYYEGDEVIFIATSGPTALAYDSKELSDHSKDYHSHGYSTPIGRWASDSITIDKHSVIKYESGFIVEGVPIRFTEVNGKRILITFRDCTVRYRDETLFTPDYGLFDLTVGESINSVFFGPADPAAFKLDYAPPLEKTHKITHSESTKLIHELYREVRALREEQANNVMKIWDKLKTVAPNDWLLALELYEISKDREIYDHLQTLKLNSPQLSSVIDNGIRLATK
jgi:phenylalanine-4-hydroxylase